MTEVGIRALKQNASAVIAAAVAGESITVTDRGRPVVQLTAISTSKLERLINTGRARQPRADLRDLPPPAAGRGLSEELAAMRDAERF